MITPMTLSRNPLDSSGMRLCFIHSHHSRRFSRWANKTLIISWSVLTTRRPLASAALKKRAMVRVCARSVQNKTRSLWPSTAMTARGRFSAGFDNSRGFGSSLPRVSWDVFAAQGSVKPILQAGVCEKATDFGEQTGRSVSESGSQPIQRGTEWAGGPPSPPDKHLPLFLTPFPPSPPQSSTLGGLRPLWNALMNRDEKNVASGCGQSNHCWMVSQIRGCTDLLFYTQETRISGKYDALFKINDILRICSS